MKLSASIVRILVASVAVFALEIIGGMLFRVNLLVPPHVVPWKALATLLTVTALSLVAIRSEWRGWRLGLAVSSIPLAIALVDLIEGRIFLKSLSLDWRAVGAQTLFVYVLAVPLWMVLYGRRTEPPPEHFHPIASRSRLDRLWRFLVSDVSYILLYFIAGMIIFPLVKSFYDKLELPSIGTIVTLQLLVRGPVFVVICLLLVRMLGFSRGKGALMVGLVFTLLSGVAPLLVPNPVFPNHVRWVHFCEVSSSNFVFGAIVGWLWGAAKSAQQITARPAA